MLMSVVNLYIAESWNISTAYNMFNNSVLSEIVGTRRVGSRERSKYEFRRCSAGNAAARTMVRLQSDDGGGVD